MPTEAKSKTVEVRVPSSLVKELQGLADAGESVSANGLVQQAIEMQINRLRRARLRGEFREAAKDPEFMRDMLETEAAFAGSDSETARLIDED